MLGRNAGKFIGLGDGKKDYQTEAGRGNTGGREGAGHVVVSFVQNIGETNTISGMHSDLRSNNTVVLVGGGRGKHKRAKSTSPPKPPTKKKYKYVSKKKC